MRLFTFRILTRAHRIPHPDGNEEERNSNLLDSNDLIDSFGGSPSGYPQLGVLLDGGAGRPGAAGVVVRKLGVG